MSGVAGDDIVRTEGGIGAEQCDAVAQTVFKQACNADWVSSVLMCALLAVPWHKAQITFCVLC